ncbi:nuclear transport factor 2 family protein [Pseudonocardia nematodicida]|uniref:Nuclear transport factor 2 family protein n=1 Tax=Pseudonocardia nematodicida TaxID=1206997 RepID=A0ABV1KHW0_9PSEU
MTRFADLDPTVRRERMAETIRVYFDGCNEADVEKMAAQFTPEGTHYFPPGIGGPWRGNRVIAENWRRLVLTAGSAWTIDRMVVEPESLQAVIEWTHWKTRAQGYLRGDEWYVFDAETGLISEIRAYYASQSDGRDEVTLEDFDYRERGYAMEPPVVRPHPDAEYTA